MSRQQIYILHFIFHNYKNILIFFLPRLQQLREKFIWHEEFILNQVKGISNIYRQILYLISISVSFLEVILPPLNAYKKYLQIKIMNLTQGYFKTVNTQFIKKNERKNSINFKDSIKKSSKYEQQIKNAFSILRKPLIDNFFHKIKTEFRRDIEQDHSDLLGEIMGPKYLQIPMTPNKNSIQNRQNSRRASSFQRKNNQTIYFISYHPQFPNNPLFSIF
ncbi:hypothetical protein pb186bvf_014911 [Paramecium bursaria]